MQRRSGQEKEALFEEVQMIIDNITIGNDDDGGVGDGSDDDDGNDDIELMIRELVANRGEHNFALAYADDIAQTATYEAE